MFMWISSKQLEKWRIIVSQFKDDVEALIAAIVQGNGTDQATKDAVAALATRADANDVTIAEIKQVITDLATKLANSPPTP